MTEIQLSAYTSLRQIMFVCDDYPQGHNVKAWVVLDDGTEEYLGYMVPFLDDVRVIKTFNIPVDEAGEPRTVKSAYVSAGWKRSTPVQVASTLITNA